jgi:fibro-slime domain-containing protein
MFRKSLFAAAVLGVLAGPVLADTIELTGTLRDFKRGDMSGGHPDFQTAGAMGRFGHVVGMVGMQLGVDNRPVYNPVRPATDTMYSADSFNQWYHDVDPAQGVNVSMPLTLTLSNGHQGAGGVYTFDNQAFFPIDGQLFGNQGLNHNFHFTLELHTKFTYRPGQSFTFIGDDDVWVYVNGTKVIDLGGVHQAVTGAVLFFDGKAFVENTDFSLGGQVQVVSTAMASSLAGKWSNLGLPGSCPIVAGRYYIDLALKAAGAPEFRAQFLGASCNVYSTANLDTVTILFDDGTEEVFDHLSIGTSGNFRGTGAFENKNVIACWVQAGGFDAGGKGSFIAADGTDSNDTKLDFFFAERHTTESHFRIDTSIVLKSTPPSTISPLYD